MDFLRRMWYSIRNFTGEVRLRRRQRRSLRLMSVHPLNFAGAHESAPYVYAIEELAYRHLSPESVTTIEDKIDGIASIGHLSWTGGTEAAEFTGERCLALFVQLMKDCDSPEELKLQIVKSLSEICCGVKQNQELAREHQLIHIIVGFMADSDHDQEIRKWCLHTLFFMLCNNIANQRYALQHPQFKVSVLRGVEDNWQNWDHNEAQELEIMTSVAMKSPPLSATMPHKETA